jgi:hypothetical protein
LYINFCGQILRPLDSVKYVGVILDKTLSMKEHVTRQVQTGNYALCRIGRIRPLLNEKVTKTIVSALVLSRLCYGCQCVAAAGRLGRLQRVQNFAARVITGTSIYDHIQPVLKRLGWLRIADALSVRSLSLIQRSVHPVINDTSRFTFRDVKVCTSQSHDTRSKTLISFDQRWGDTEVRKRTATLWNELPRNIRELKGPQTFKKAVMRHFLAQ